MLIVRYDEIFRNILKQHNLLLNLFFIGTASTLKYCREPLGQKWGHEREPGQECPETVPSSLQPGGNEDNACERKGVQF